MVEIIKIVWAEALNFCIYRDHALKGVATTEGCGNY